MTDELKPCPFCGGEAYTRTRQDEDVYTDNIVDWHFVGCSNCDVSFGIPDGYDCGTASEQWNTRADLANPLDDPRVKALVEAAKAAEAVLAQYYVGNKAIAKRKLRKALSALEENK